MLTLSLENVHHRKKQIKKQIVSVHEKIKFLNATSVQKPLRVAE